MEAASIQFAENLVWRAAEQRKSAVTLLKHVFGEDILASHSLAGRKKPALNRQKVNAYIRWVRRKTGLSENKIRSWICQTCSIAQKKFSSESDVEETVVELSLTTVSSDNNEGMSGAGTSGTQSVPITPARASNVPQKDGLMELTQNPSIWQGLLDLGSKQAAVQMYFVSGNDDFAKLSLPANKFGCMPPVKITRRIPLHQLQGVRLARKMQMVNNHCLLLALPGGIDSVDVLQQSKILGNDFISYLHRKQAAGIIETPGTTQHPAFVIFIFPPCNFVYEHLRRVATNLLQPLDGIAHLLIVITTK